MDEKVTYTILGDSISLGYSPFVEKYFPGNYQVLKHEGDKEAFINLDLPKGSNCGDSSRLLSFVSDYAKDGALKRDFYIVNCGLHDIKADPEDPSKHQVELELYKENLKKIFEVFKEAGKKVYWVTTTDVDDETHNSRSKTFKRYHKDVVAYNEAAEEVCKNAGVPMIDLYTFTWEFGKEAFRDHVHYPEEISDKQARLITDFILKDREN